MPKQPTFPTLYDDAHTLSTSNLKKWGYLKPWTQKTGEVTWRRGDHVTAKIAIAVNMEETSGTLTLKYSCNDEPLKYEVRLTSVPSNLGNGLIWYFICPHTSKRCRKLYLIGKYFFHREAFRNCMYESQTRSQRDRTLTKTLESTFAPEKYMEGRRLYFKRFYRGKPTKSYLKLLQLQREAVKAMKISIRDFI